MRIPKKISLEQAASAYNTNIDQAILDQIKKHRVPIVYRESTIAAQAIQQNNRVAKPQSIKNKSSELPHLAGLVPCKGLAGKRGDKLRTFEQSCPSSIFNWSVSDIHNYFTLQSLVKSEDHLIREIKSQGNYQCTPVRVQKNGTSYVVVYSNRQKSATSLVKESEVGDREIAQVLADSSANPITADTDLVLVGIPRSEAPQSKKIPIIYDDQYGFRTPLTDEVRLGINSRWQALTGNTNAPIQHGDESMFGLNPLDTIFKCYGVDGKIQKFDLSYSNKERESALKQYAKWLSEQSQYAHIPIPTQALQRARAQYLADHYQISLDQTQPWKDYQIIRQEMTRLGTEPLDSPVSFTQQKPKTTESLPHSTPGFSCTEEEDEEREQSQSALSCSNHLDQFSILSHATTIKKALQKGLASKSLCRHFKNHEKQKSLCLCERLVLSSLLCTAFTQSEWDTILTHVSSLDLTEQYHFLKNLAQSKTEDARDTLNKVLRSCKSSEQPPTPTSHKSVTPKTLDSTQRKENQS